MRAFSSAVMLAMLLASPLRSGAQTSSHFFPIRPARVTVKTMTGVLAAWGQGNDTAGLAINEPHGKLVQFYMGRHRTVNGRVYDCLIAPEPGKPRDRDNCREWPRNIVIGRTMVRVTYWLQKAPWGEYVKVSDAIKS